MSKRKAYKPKRVITNPLNFLFSGLKRINPDELTELRIKNHKAIVDVTTGQSDRETWNKITGCVNISLILTEYGLGRDYHDDLIAGRDALIAMGRRYLKHDRFGFTGDELKTINQMMEIHDAQLEIARVIDIERAVAEIDRRLRHGINTFHVVEQVAA